VEVMKWPSHHLLEGVLHAFWKSKAAWWKQNKPAALP
jgi:hypothetical protein